MYIVEFYNKEGYNPCGSDFTRIYKNLKTSKTLKNLKFLGTRKDITYYNIYKCYNIYNRSDYKFIEKIELNN